MTHSKETRPSTYRPLTVEDVLAKQRACYGASFNEKWGKVQPGELVSVWGEWLCKLTPDEIRRGLEHLPKEWPPTPMEFYEIAKPPADYESAYFQAVRNMRLREEDRDSWTDPAAYWAATAIGAAELLGSSYSPMKTRWKAEYDRARADICAGVVPNSVPVRRRLLPRPGLCLTDRATAKKNLQELLGRMTGKKPRADELGWAKRILVKHVEQPDSVSRHQLEEAKAALRVYSDRQIQAVVQAYRESCD